jgi:hypothetical protein
MADQPKASSIPKIATYEDYDVLSGKAVLSRDEYKNASFHTSDMTEGDAKFKQVAELIGSSGSELLGQEEANETGAEKKAEVRLDAQEKESSL